MPAIRTQSTNKPATRPKRRFSSPLLPSAILLMGDGLLERAQEEGDRATQNAEVTQLRDVARAAPLDKEKMWAFLHEVEDYEELYGRYVADAENDALIARRDELLRALLERREIISFTPLWDIQTLSEYKHDVDCFEAEFRMSADPDDLYSKSIHLQCAAVEYYESLMDAAKGDMEVASEIAGKSFRFTVANPYASNDRRRRTFDNQLRHLLAYFRLADGTFDLQQFPPTLGRRHWVFSLPNPYGPLTQDRLDYWCYRQVYRDEVLEEVEAARADASKPPKRGSSMVSPSTFEKMALLLDVVYLPPIAPIMEGSGLGLQERYKARRSLKTLPCLPPSPFDRKISRRRRHHTKPPTPTAANAPIPMPMPPPTASGISHIIRQLLRREQAIRAQWEMDTFGYR
ncbi:hypothetical protein B0H11DRAFT_1939367 [Mycena galericulata]|nr:hypothetical protein B0H11DRAFT_1939367 [Mycena galericulata]